MASALQDIASVVNVALVKIGWKQGIGDLRDGSAAASLALDIYSQTRDELLRKTTWGFAERNIVLTLLKSAPAGGYVPPIVWNPTDYPPQAYWYEYAYPDDCLLIRAVKPSVVFVPNFDPTPNVFSIANDNAFAPPRRVILTNVANALAVYTGQIGNPSTWDVGFAEALIDELGKRLAPALTGLEAAKMESVAAANSSSRAAVEQG